MRSVERWMVSTTSSTRSLLATDSDDSANSVCM